MKQISTFYEFAEEKKNSILKVIEERHSDPFKHFKISNRFVLPVL